MHIIYVDDEKPALDNFWLTVKDFPEIESLHLFQKGEEAIDWVMKNHVDTAFLDMEMQGIHGLELAKKLKEIDKNIRIVFMTAYGQYALQAFSVDAIGYVLKPYTRQDVHKELKKAALIRQRPEKQVVIQTIPNFVVSVDGIPLFLGRAKPEELLALLVDRGRKKYIRIEQVECDLYRILDGDTEAIRAYGGDYMKEYSWAETRNAQLNSMKNSLVGKNG